MRIKAFKKLAISLTVILLGIVISGCKQETETPPVRPNDSNGYKPVSYYYETYDEMITGLKTCEKKKFSYVYDVKIDGAIKYEYKIDGRKSSYRDDFYSELITPDVIWESSCITIYLAEEKVIKVIFESLGEELVVVPKSELIWVELGYGPNQYTLIKEEYNSIWYVRTYFAYDVEEESRVQVLEQIKAAIPY
ncbi:MAG: hypothetical protein K2N64_06490 [Anaeroplasmataceae bacterium]|nr:hypothetical protein [Anaeroplasmataceae bacterium]